MYNSKINKIKKTKTIKYYVEHNIKYVLVSNAKDLIFWNYKYNNIICC